MPSFVQAIRRVCACRAQVRSVLDSLRISRFEGRPLRKGVVWIVIVSGHALLFLIFERDSNRPAHITVRNAEDRSELFFVNLPKAAEEQPAISPKSKPPRRVRLPERSSMDTTIAVTPEDSSAIRPPVDWYSEAETVARLSIEKGASNARVFGEIPKSPYRRCVKKASSFRWESEPQKAGMIGIFPYVRLGKRCLVSIGFFGCALGELPKANGKLFDDMHDPETQESSVPSLDECGS